MAKPLSVTIPTSAVAGLLETGAVRAALTEPVTIVKRAEPHRLTGEVPSIKREFLLTEAADDSLRLLTTLLSKSTGTQVTNSHFLRAVLKALIQAMPDLEKQAWRIGRLKRPSNARGKEAEREAYEDRLADALLSGMRAGRTSD